MLIFLLRNKILSTLCFWFCIQNLLEKTNATDASGNIVYGDIGVHIQQEVRDFVSFDIDIQVMWVD